MTGLCYVGWAGYATNTQLSGENGTWTLSVSEPFVMSALSYLVLGWLMFFLWRF